MVATNNELRAYLPSKEMDEHRYPDRRYFWGVMATICSAFTGEYVRRVLAIKHESKASLPEKKVVAVSNEWLKRLTEHDFVSKFRGQRNSILIE
jgi:hypothetical protein